MNAQSPAEQAGYVFISYAREDLLFVQCLIGLLESAGLRVWVDVKGGLYGGEEFWPEISKAIDGATVVVYVISPESVESRHCRKELKRALEDKKHIVSVCLREVNHELLLEEIASRQWVPFREKDDAEVSRADLLRAIRANWTWLRQHARLLVRAQEWKTSGHDRSLTLRGRELREAQEWLTRVPEEEIRPTTLHEAFIRASLDAQKYRILQLATGSMGALAIIVVVSWFALTQLIDSLSSGALNYFSENDVTNALSDLRWAEKLCSVVPFTGDRCNGATNSLERAYLEAGQFDDALALTSRLIEASTTVGLDRAAALRNRAFAHIMRAETMDSSQREGEYALAETDLNAAITIYGELPAAELPEEADRLSVELTRARIDLGHGNYQQALTELEDAARATDAPPDVNLLLSVAYRCLGNGSKSEESFRVYITHLPGLSRDPHWLQNQDYFKRIAGRCSNKPQ